MRTCWPSEAPGVVVNDLGGTMEGDGADPEPARTVAGEIGAAGGRRSPRPATCPRSMAVKR